MEHEPDDIRNPGEARNRARQRRKWAFLIFAGLVVSVYAHVIYFTALKDHDANLVVPFPLLHPLMTVALGAWLTGDPVGFPLLVGGAIAVAGVSILVLRPSETFTKRFLVRSRL